MKNFLLVLIVAAIAGIGGWRLGTRHSHSASAPPTADSRRILYYQSPMHPWVKSDKPGKCSVCGMDLVPIYEGGQNSLPASPDVVLLPEGSSTATNVQTVEVKKQPLVRTLKVAGIIEDDDSRHRFISAYIGGRIQKLFVNYEGAEVEKGQPLVSYYSKDLLNAANEYKVLRKQANSESLLSPSEQRLMQLGLTREQIDAIPKRSDSDLYFEILAPSSGTVVNRYVYEGQYVQEGEKLFELADFTTMWFQFIAYEQDLPFIQVGAPVTIHTPSLPGKTYQSRISFINPNLDMTTRSARVRVELKNPTSETGLHQKHELLHQLYATGTVELEAPEVLAVPRSAVLWTGGNPRIYVELASGAYQQRKVVLGRPGDETWEVLEGLKPGERVVASGNMLIDGQAQLNNLAAPPEDKKVAPVESMNADQHTAVEKYLLAVAEVTDALADDDLAAYNNGLTKLPAPPEGVKVTPPASAGSLPEARKGFFQLSESAAEYARSVQTHFPKLKVFRCPMSDQADGVPKNARWIQFSDNLRNPFMGHEMLECGVEVK